MVEAFWPYHPSSRDVIFLYSLAVVMTADLCQPSAVHYVRQPCPGKRLGESNFIDKVSLAKLVSTVWLALPPGKCLSVRTSE